MVDACNFFNQLPATPLAAECYRNWTSALPQVSGRNVSYSVAVVSCRLVARCVAGVFDSLFNAGYNDLTFSPVYQDRCAGKVQVSGKTGLCGVNITKTV